MDNNLKYYLIFKRQYNIFANDYVVYKEYIATSHIYYYVGEQYCTSLEKIDRIDYYEISKDEYEKNKHIFETYWNGVKQ